MTISRHLPGRIAAKLIRLAHGDAGAGLILLGCAALALVLANSSLAEAWHHLLHGKLPLIGQNLHYWINDGLMAIFFFVVGLEIKREVLDGELASAARRRLPVIAAAAGMAMPALVFLAVARNTPGIAPGWAIPAATDIAFAVGVLALAGKGLPPSLRLFLLTVAIVDDLGAVAIIALFYTAGIDLIWGVGALAALAAMLVLNRSGVRRGAAYVPLAVIAWYCTLHSGVHATIAGVLAAMTIPMQLDRRGDSLLLRMEHAVAPWSAYVIVPLFGLANAGVELGAGVSLFAALPLAVALGLFVGKQVGILGAILLAEKFGLAKRPAGASTLQLWGLAALCGIGFTMSLFIAALAFPTAPLMVEEAKLGVLAGSALSGLLGFVLLRLASR
ncbi:Na+/H+ antiporter NhaA [Novosphingobium sp.]|uniref:Na+/H+ antiporter NhaA n=1 Tax=Novosphingobium sp. TaxID=1874826 RepID=UPI00286EB2C8|nr:Na+/H+ antiporter NhaA [Novosphingobium sp.]